MSRGHALTVLSALGWVVFFGVTLLLPTPLKLERFQAGVVHAFRATRCAIHPSLVTFLPAKAGSGSSITAFNAAAAVAYETDREVLLVDGDLHSGILSIRAGIKPVFYLQDVLENLSMLSHSEWLRCVVREHGMDILPAGPTRVGAAPQWNHYYNLLEYVDREYDTVVVDLPETMTDETAEVVLRASQIYVVCTVDGPSMELGRRRLAELGQLGVDPNRVSAVFNRWHTTDPSPKQLGEQTGCPVAKLIPNDYASVRSATEEGRPVSWETGIGGAYRALANRIAGMPDVEPSLPEPDATAKDRLTTLVNRISQNRYVRASLPALAGPEDAPRQSLAK